MRLKIAECQTKSQTISVTDCSTFVTELCPLTIIEALTTYEWQRPKRVQYTWATACEIDIILSAHLQ